MANVKICDRDGKAFREKAANSVRIANATIYHSGGVASSFTGDLCPDCGKALIDASGILQLPDVMTEPDQEMGREE